MLYLLTFIGCLIDPVKQGEEQMKYIVVVVIVQFPK